MTYEEQRKYERLNNQYTNELIDLTTKRVQTDIPLLKIFH